MPDEAKLPRFHSLERLRNANCAEEELIALEEFRESIYPSSPGEDKGDADLESEWLKRGLSDQENPFPGTSPENCICSQDDLNHFTFYLFERRYGWSEYNIGSVEDDGLEAHVGRRSSTGSLRIQDDSKFKSRLNDLTDRFLKWYLAQPAVSAKMLESLHYAVSKANNMPVVRNQTFVHAMEWMKLASEDGFDSNVFPLVKDLIVAGITDVWSAIRNTCVAKLAHILDSFTLQQVEAFYNNLIKICQGKDNSWQAKEGAVMGMTTVVQKFQWTGTVMDLKSCSDDPDTTQYFLKFGQQKLTALPDFIMNSIHSVLYSLLANSQLSIREHVTIAFSSVLARCEFQVALSSFQEVVKRLCRGTQAEYDFDEEGAIKQLPHTAVFRADFKFLKAHEAEGLLGVCVFLIKHIPPGFLLPNWPLYFSTFNLYLMHPASTVRQATSAVFKYLVAKDSSNPVLLKLVLQGLASEWQVDEQLLTEKIEVTNRTVEGAISEDNDGPDLLRKTKKHQPHCDETKRFLNPSPDVQTRSTTTPSPTPDLFPVSPRSLDSSGSFCRSGTPSGGTPDLQNPSSSLNASWSSQKPARISIRQVSKLAAECHSSEPRLLASEAWEWREGRLLAYELILRFLITNHIHYIFPTFALSSTRASASQSVDENLIGSLTNREDNEPFQGRGRSNSDDPPPKMLVLKSNSAGLICPEYSPLYSTTTIKEGESGVLEKESAKRNAIKKKTKRSASFATSDVVQETKRIIRQYSVVSQVAPKRPFRPPRKGSYYALASSLLSQTRVLDSEQQAKAQDSSEFLAQSLTSPFGKPEKKTDHDAAEENPFKFQASSSLSEEAELPEWTNSLQLTTLSCILSQVLLQTTECLADSRWELRRMGQQVLPLVSETVRWFDMEALVNLWNKRLTRDNTLLCYGACIALKYSITHAGRLMHFLEQPPSTWKDPETCGRAALAVVTEIHKGLRSWIAQIHVVLKNPYYDKITVVAMETMMLSHICFPFSPEQLDQKLAEEVTVLNKMLHIFVYSYPDNPLSGAVRSVLGVATLPPFLSPTEGFLCCSSKCGSQDQRADQVGRYMISEVHYILPRFLKNCDVDQMFVLFPVLVHYVNVFSEEPAVCRSLVEGLFCLILRIEQIQTGQDAVYGNKRKETESLVYFYLDFALLAVCEVINSKALELPLFRDVLDLFLRVAYLLEKPKFLGFVFKAITTRLDYDPDLVRLMNEEEGGSRTETPDLFMLSNDIPTSPVDEPAILAEEEDEPGSGRVMRESLALDVSLGSSNRGTPRVPTPDDQEQSAEEFSDWDSWDGENEDQTALAMVLSEFLRQLRDMYGSKRDGERSVFVIELQKCGEMEQRAIKNIMESQR